MNKETLKTEKIDKSLLITFTRPDEMNTFSGKMMVEIMETLDEADSDAFCYFYRLGQSLLCWC